MDRGPHHAPRGTPRPNEDEEQDEEDAGGDEDDAHDPEPHADAKAHDEDAAEAEASSFESPPEGLRVVSLIPAATEIVGRLGLAGNLVGATHECDFCPNPHGDGDGDGTEDAGLASVRRIISSAIDPARTSQAGIDAQVKAHARSGSGGDDDAGHEPLYAMDAHALADLAPTVVLAQSLCAVCAVTVGDVKRGIAALPPDQSGARLDPRYCGLSSRTLDEVGRSIEAVGVACGVPARAKAARETFANQIRQVTQAVNRNKAMSAEANGNRNGNGDGSVALPAAAGLRLPRVALLEWLAPVFDGGHWVPGMVRAAGCVPCLNADEGATSREHTWDDVHAADPDVVLVACCGFDVRRNAADALEALAASRGPKSFANLRAVKSGRVFVLNGNRYFARPSPSLAQGTALIARCAYADQPRVVAALEQLPFYPECAKAPAAASGKAWVRLTPETARQLDLERAGEDGGSGPSAEVCAPSVNVEDLDALHAKACERGDFFYTDPSSGYMVMTRLKHESRGKCCGSGCRHCPFAHANVTNKALRIQQPAFMHVPTAGGLAPEVTVLMWSGGKDSFLALRAMLRPGGISHGAGPAGVVLLTTFDAATRVVAHQDVHVRDIERQAKHLDVGLVGVPLHGNAGVGYVSRLAAALEVVAGATKVKGFACGDLHLRHVRDWREDALGLGLGVSIHYPLWSDVAGSNYPQLSADLQASGVPCKVMAVEEEKAKAAGAAVGVTYGPELAGALAEAGLDPFGENGEVHTLAQVWEVPREQALGVLL